MFVNLLILLVVIVIAAFSGWLTFRAVKAQRLWVKISGGLGAGLLTLVFAGLSLAGGRGFIAGYFPGADPAPELTVQGTPAQVARGEYLVNLACIGCHGAVDSLGKPSGNHPLSGSWNISAEEGFGFIGNLYTENLTPGGKLVDYTDGELFRALRYGYDKNGRLLTSMSLLGYNQLSNEDTEAIIAYLRTLQPAVSTAPTGDQLNFLGIMMLGAGLFGEPQPAAADITAPPQGVTAKYGKYVATFGDCRYCHGPDMTGSAATSLSPAIMNPRPFVGTLTLEEFTQTMRTGVRPNGTAFSAGMPWQNASKMTNEDLEALYVYLTAPVQ